MWKSKVANWCFVCLFIVIAALIPAEKSYSQIVKIGWEAWPPYQQQEEGGALSGLDLEIVAAAVEAAKFTAEFVEMSWGRLLEEAKSGDMHVATGASKTAEREEWAYFSETYRAESVVLFVRRGESSKYDVSSFSDFAKTDMQVGGVIGYYYGEEYDSLIKTDSFRSHVQLVRDGSLNYEKLRRGRIDGFLQDPFVGKNQIDELGFSGQFEVHSVGPLYRDDIYFLISKKIPQAIIDGINSGLRKIKENGVHAEILKKYSDLN